MDDFKKPDYHHGNVKNELVSTAMLLLEDEGIEKISLRRLAREIGITPAAVYNHFEHKQQLMAAIKAKAYDVYINFFETNCKPEKEPEAAFGSLCKAYVNFSLLHPSLFEVLFIERAPMDIGQENDASSLLSRPNLLVSSMKALYKKYEIPATEDRMMRSCMLMWAQLHGLIVLRNSGAISSVLDGYDWSDNGALDETVILENLIKQMTNGLYTTLRLQQAVLKAEGKI